MKFLSVCSGIEAASVAWGPLGWKAAGFSEVEPFPCAVLKHHYPDVTNYGDLTQWERWLPDVPKFDVLTGGTPCQGFSVAGRRGGLDDPRSQLAFDFLGIARERQPRWVVWENVPGVLSTNKGRDFGAFLGELGKCGYGFAYRILDAQYFGVAQRRRRVFVVGYLGDWRPAAAVLLEPESLRGDSAPSRETGEGLTYDVAPCIGASGRSGKGETDGRDPVVAHVGEVAPAMTSGSNTPAAHGARSGDVKDSDDALVAHTLRSGGSGNVPSSRGEHIVVDKPICASSGQHNAGFGEDQAPTLDATNDPAYMANGLAVRRLTPTECERLQGFPDGYLDIPGYKSSNTGKYGGNHGVPDGPKYKALGNSWAVPCVRWIGERIMRADQL